jgi:MFS family permease
LGSITATIVAHALIAFLFVHPIVPNILMGIAYSILAASLWPMVAFLVPKKMLGTAYGFMQSIQNLGLAVMYGFIFLFLLLFEFSSLEIFLPVLFLIIMVILCLKSFLSSVWKSLY